MLEAIANSLPMSVGVAMSPLSIAFVMVMLSTNRARVNAPAFVVGWVTGILVVGIIVLVAPGIETSDGEPTVVSGVIRMVLGALLLLLAVGQWRNRPAPDAPIATPKLLARLDGIGAVHAFVTGLLLSGASPMNTVLIAAGAAAIDMALLDFAPQVMALLAFAAIASLTVALPVAVYFLARQRAEALFHTWKEWLIRNNTTMLIALMIVFGTLLIWRGLRVVAA